MILRVPKENILDEAVKVNAPSKHISPLNEGFDFGDSFNVFDDPIQDEPQSFYQAETGVSEQEIEDCKKFLDFWNVKNYEIVKSTTDFKVNVDGFVWLPNCKMKSIPFKFGKVHGDFNVAGNDLKSYANFPDVVEGNLIFGFNRFKNFNGLRTVVSGNIVAAKQKVKTQYPLTTDNYKKFIEGTLLENRVVTSSGKSGELVSILEEIGQCKIRLDENGEENFYDVNEVYCLGSIESLML